MTTRPRRSHSDPQTAPKRSPFEDPVALARVVAILRRGYKRYLAEQNPDNQPDEETGQRPTPGEAA